METNYFIKGIAKTFTIFGLVIWLILTSGKITAAPHVYINSTSPNTSPPHSANINFGACSSTGCLQLFAADSGLAGRPNNYTYRWYDPSGLAQTSIGDSTYMICSITYGPYDLYCVVTDSLGVSYTTPIVRVAVDDPPFPLLGYTLDTINLYGQVQISIPVSSVHIPLYADIIYTSGGQAATVTVNPQGDAAILTIPSVAYADSGSYIVSVYTDLCPGPFEGPLETEIVLKVVPPGCQLSVSDTITPVSCYAASDGQVRLGATGGAAPYSYKLGVNGAWQYSSVFPNLTAGIDTFYIRDTSACAQPVSIVLDIPLSPALVPSISVIGSSRLCSGFDDTLHATFTNAGTPASFQWYKNGTTVGSNSPQYIVTSVQPGDSVWVTMTDTVHCAIPVVSSAHFPITVHPTPPAPTLTDVGACIGRDSLVVSGATGAPEIIWYLNGTATHFADYLSYTAAGGNGLGNASDQFDLPTGAFLDSAGYLYVTDFENARVQRFAPGSTAMSHGVTVAGGNGTGSAANQLNHPTALYIDHGGNIYVADGDNNRIQKFPAGSTSSTNAITVAGGNGRGNNANQLHGPNGIYFDHSGYMFVSDMWNDRVQKFPPGSTSATNGVTAAGGNGSGSAANQLVTPGVIFIDSNDNLYVPEYSGNARVQKFPAGSTSSTNGITVAGGNGQGNNANQLNSPLSVVGDRYGNIYVADVSNARIQKFPAGSTSATNGMTIAGGNNTLLYLPGGMYIDSSDNLYVADAYHYRVQKYPLHISGTAYHPAVAGSYTSAYTSPEGCMSLISNTVMVNICNPAGADQSICQGSSASLAASGTGVWTSLASNPSVATITTPSYPATTISGLTSVGSYSFVWTTSGGRDTVVISVLASPPAPSIYAHGVCLGADTIILSGTSGGSHIHWYDNGTLIDSAVASLPGQPYTVAGTSTYGNAANQLNLDSNAAYQIPLATFTGDIYMDQTGNLYVPDFYNNRVQKFPPGSTSGTNGVTIAGGNGRGSAANQLNGPTSVYIDRSGYLYVADALNHRVQKFPPGSTSATNGVTVAGGNGVGSALNQLNTPLGLAIDTSGVLYLSDNGNARVLKFPAGSTSATNGTVAAGGNGSGSAANQLPNPTGLFVTSAGELYVTDWSNNRVQKFPAGSTSSTNGITVAGGSNGGSADDQLAAPYDIFMDAAGYLYVSDLFNDRVQKFPPGSTSGSHAITIAGIAEDTGTAVNLLTFPTGIWVAASGDLYVADAGNNRIQKWPAAHFDTAYIPHATGSYTATVISGNGCSSPASNAVAVNACSALAGPDQTICLNSISVMAASGVGVWNVLASNPAPTTFTDHLSPTTSVSGFTLTGTYGLVWTVGGVSDTVWITVIASSASLFTFIQPFHPYICSGSIDTFIATGTGNATSFIWYQNGVVVGDSSSWYIPSSLSPHDSIWAIGIDSMSTCPARDTSPVFYPVIQPLPATPVLTPAGGTCLGLDSLLLSGASGALQIDWYHNGILIDSSALAVSTIAANQINDPEGMFLTSSGDLYVSNLLGNSVLKFPAGSTSTTVGTIVAGGNGAGGAANQLGNPSGIFIDAGGYLYVCDEVSRRIQRFPPGSTSSTNAVTVAGNGWGTGPTQFGSPTGVYVDATGNIYVADFDNNRIQKFPAGSTSSTPAVTAAGGNGPGSAANQLNGPRSIYVDASGALYVADYGNHRIQKFTAGSTSGTNGVTVAGGNGPGAGANQLYAPMAVYVDASGNVYVADGGNDRVQRFPSGSTSATNGMTVAGGYGRGSGPAQLNSPSALSVDASVNIYTADAGNNRVQKCGGARVDSLYIPTAAGSYDAIVVSAAGCGSSTLSNVITINICLSDSVWPGDADHNGVADNNDLLPIGTAYGLSGPIRPAASIVWQGQACTDWGLQLLNGTNIKHADCNGDGTINATDTVAIMTNFGLTHTKTNQPAPWRSGTPGMRIIFSKDTVYQGDTLITTFILGDSLLPATNISGFAFTYNYDPTVVDSTLVSFSFIPSWLGGATDAISISRDFVSTGTLKAAITRIDHTNRSGHGPIGVMVTRISTDNINGKDLAYYADHCYISDIVAIDSAGIRIPINEGQDSTQVAYTPTAIRETYENSTIGIYPNPAKDRIRIISTNDIQLIAISDMLGKEVVAKAGPGKQIENIDISSLADGVYIVSVSTQSRSKELKLIINR